MDLRTEELIKSFTVIGRQAKLAGLAMRKLLGKKDVEVGLGDYNVNKKSYRLIEA